MAKSLKMSLAEAKFLLGLVAKQKHDLDHDEDREMCKSLRERLTEIKQGMDPLFPTGGDE